MEQRFRNCGLECRPDEGVLLEFTPEDLCTARTNIQCERQFESSNKSNVMLDTIFRMMVRKPDFSGYHFPEYGVFLFRPETGFSEEDGTAKYQIFQVVLFRSGGAAYAYIVLDEVKPGADLVEEKIRRQPTYRLRGVSKVTPVPCPEYHWFNNPDNWVYWSRVRQNFNACICSV